MIKRQLIAKKSVQYTRSKRIFLSPLTYKRYKKVKVVSPSLCFSLRIRQTIEHFACSIMRIADEDWTVELIESHFETLRCYWSDFTDNHIRFMTTSADRTHEYFQSEEYLMAEATSINTKGVNCRTYVPVYSVHGPLTTSTQSHGEALHNTGLASGRHDASTRQRLPNIELPRFDWVGDFQGPLSLFNSRGSQHREAVKALKSTQVTKHTYETAWNR